MGANVSIRLSVEDADKVTAAFSKIEADQDAWVQKLIAANNRLASNYAALGTQIDQIGVKNQDVATSYSDVAAKASDFTGSIAQTVEHVLNATNHLKLLALAAYAVSPAFRSVVNVGISTAFGRVPTAANLAAQAIGRITPVMSPLLSLFSRVSAPIGAAVVAWEGLNYVIGQGADILEKYKGSERSLFGPDVDSELAKLTRLQPDETLSPEQIKYATQLASRLEEAKKNIADFMKIQIDVSGPALRLQGIWVGIVSLIGQAAKAANNINLPESDFGNSAFFKAYNDWVKQHGMGGIGLPGSLSVVPDGEPLGKSDRLTGTPSDDIRSARARLAIGMGGGFTGRFTGDIDALSKSPDAAQPKADTKDAWDRETHAIEKQNASLIAETGTVDKNEAAHAALKAELQLLTAAKDADRGVTEKSLTQYETLRGSMSADQAMQAAGIKLKNDDVAAFDRLIQKTKEATQASAEAKLRGNTKYETGLTGLSDDDQSVARQLVPLYGHDIPAAMASTEAAELRQLQALQKTRAEIGQFSQTVGDDLASAVVKMATGAERGAAAWRSFGLQVVQSLEEMIAKAMIAEPVMKLLQGGLTTAFTGARPGGGGGLLGLLGLNVGGGSGDPMTFSPATGAGAYGNGNSYPMFAAGGVMTSRGPVPLRRYAAGGVASSPQLAMFGEGSGPEAYVPLPDGRSIPVNVKGAGGGGHVINSTLNVHMTVPPGTSTEDAHRMTATAARQMQAVVDQAVDNRIVTHMRTGGLLNPA